VWSYRRHSRVSPVLAVCASLLCSLTIVPRPAAADPGPGNTADRAHRAVNRAEAVLEDATVLARLAARRLETATAALPAAQHQVATSRGLVAAAVTASATASRKANAARAAYATIAGSFEQARQQVQTAHDRVDEIARTAYMGGNLSQLNMLVEATGPADIMDRLGLVDQVMRGQQADVDHLMDASRLARIEQDRAGLAKRAAEEAELAARARLADAKAAQAAAVRAQQSLVRLAATRQAALQLANTQRAAVLARYRAAVAEESRIRAALRGWSARSGSGRYGGGKLLMPVAGWKSSEFGERYDPYYRVWQLHAGTDFAAGEGTPIHAAAAGKVIQAGWRGGYGRYTCLSHGRLGGTGFSTCYGHQSAILVRVGEYVRRGEVIGRVGTTGASTGSHLHFETRFNGVPRNPLRYLPGCLC
jgi:murein DD-endopeptidase MepM/ murein hydrolase activator NlpD